MFNTIGALILDPNVRWIIVGCMLLGLSSGVIGSFMVLRKQSLIGDALAHAALPGICIAFMLSGVKSTGGFFIGALVAGVIATFGIRWITQYSRIKQDAAMGIILSFFFGVGVLLLTHIQHSGDGGQSGLDKYLFGQAASMMQSDVYVLAGISILMIVICIALFRLFKLISFDPGFARGMGLPVAFLEQLLLLLTVIIVVAGIQAVGVVLMSALLITPAIAARFWTDRLHIMVILSGIFGALSGLIGTLWSGMVSQLPTGPVTVLAATVFFAISALGAPRRGWLAKLWSRKQTKDQWHRQGGISHE
ncbi:metal ABC transporter permease [Paenibacillus kyungheensis]|uniref:Manganese transport system membrane protein MntC n=1 Tax=Paenibacillus kyungheensis TaxID=1452732 RepID=A0AAX3M005_9BACL|nr:metal ABC transporter permease [Paenibacillus kyungheensis]WCT55066.1 metal ABC transporter permease [Paenibacillus kyungheensis]